MKGKISFSEKVKQNFFHPEVYVYPTSRVYKPLIGFDLSHPEFTKEVNLYIHYPFCKQICSYCGYLKTMDVKGDLREEYVDALIAEIKSYSDILSDKVIKTLHFGGGTPSLMTVSEIERILTVLLDINPDLLETAKEVSIEATPESVGFYKFSCLKRLGFNRISIGVQTTDAKEIGFCNRKNSFETSAEAIRTLKDIGFENIVADLMIGIQGQTVQSFERSLNSLIKLRPETVELYALGLMPNTRIGNFSGTLMTTKEIYDCYSIGREIFLGSGYRQACHNRYEIPEKGSFLQEDNVFQGMSLIGFGAGARSYAENMHYRNIHYSKNHRQSVIDYIQLMKKGMSAVLDGTFLEPEEKLRQFAIYKIEELDENIFFEKFGIEFKKKFAGLYEDLFKFGLAEKNGDILKLTERGLNFRDLIAEELFSEEVGTAEELYRPR